MRCQRIVTKRGPRDADRLITGETWTRAARANRQNARQVWGALCRLASGGSFAVRQLYTDDDEVLFQATRPLLLNGIEDVISRPDLADRSIFLTLPHVADARRQSERELWRQFELGRPRIIGALLDLVVHGL